ncbi:zinc finger BED domain-containing protein RICESLEEPER 2-like [Durio zibethinus]|uniref:Zinc finger BED domain-containing protein RICESLEEPER 2-like n=1 Tax=Durio zibethinus TaxID=66656 RepID=A0A6P5Z7S5_DURZI|nr:zinc finger BED domain-containing protein RICESLEEPER 2-like [Durio zibethinus]
MIILNELPFRFVESKGFRHCISVACPRFRVHHDGQLLGILYQLYIDEKTHLKQFMKSSFTRVSLTTDTWTSLQRVNYMCLTAHFIDKDWKLNKKILNFCPISSHKGEAIGKTVEKCLHDSGIDKIFTIAVDNASSNDVTIAYLRKKFNNAGTSILGGKYLHLRCIARIVNLIVCDGLKEMNETIARVKGTIRYMRQLPSRLAKFKESQKFERAFDAFDDVDPYYRASLMIKKVHQAIEDLFNEYKRMLEPQSEQVGESSQVSQMSQPTDDESENGMTKKKESFKSKYKRYRIEHGKDEHKSELAKYLSEEPDNDDSDDFDVLTWWKLNSHRFPILFHLARDVLAILISTIAFESTFSTGSRVLDAYMSSLTPKIVQALICAQD